MNNTDSDLIKRTLEGDQHAFTTLVEKYQDRIHALAWQKIGDFHIAQEITQDTFITAYQKLATLKHPTRFAGWLYVITNNNCKMWHRKNRVQTQSLEETDPVELEKVYFSNHQIREREEAANEKRRSLVKKLLSKLRESDRTVITLHYLAGMSCEEIAEFLGVATNTVKSRLHRARNRLRKEESLLQENLSSFQLPEQLTQNIMQTISKLTPATPATNKPIMPWVISTASAIFIFILIGAGAYQLYRFQKPYSLDATSERTIEITEAKQVIDSPEKTAARNQTGRSVIQDRNNSVSQDPNSQLADRTQTDTTTSTNKNDIVQKGLVSLSGNVVDTNGKAVHGLELTIKPVEIDKRGNMVARTPISSWKQVVTDKQGGFSFKNIDPVATQLTMLPEAGSDYEIISLKIGDLTFYAAGPQQYLPTQFGKLTFAIEPGVPLNNTIVTVKPPPRRIRGRILLKDGTPLANTEIDLTVRQRTRETFLFIFSDSESSSNMSTLAKTDSQGYFVTYLSQAIYEEYLVSVMFNGASASSKWFRLKDGKWKDDLVFRLRLKDTEKIPKKMKKRLKAQQAIWSINPNNGHAYKKIQCDSWEDAKAKAESEKAYLVAINDEAEQKWLEARFAEYLFYWIGLRSKQDGTFQQWINGEKLTYTNWLSTEVSTGPNTPIALDFFSKRWMVLDSNSQFLFAIKYAIIEKENVAIKSRKIDPFVLTTRMPPIALVPLILAVFFLTAENILPGPVGVVS